MPVIYNGNSIRQKVATPKKEQERKETRGASANGSRDDMIRSMHKKGVSITEIAIRVGYASRASAVIACKRLGLMHLDRQRELKK